MPRVGQPTSRQALASAIAKYNNRKPLWEGPNGDGPNGGVTQSLFGRFLACRERFRLYVVEGYRPREGFNHRLEYGNMWHVCEEALGQRLPWLPALKAYAQKLVQQHPGEAQEVNKWFRVCKVQFPIYVDYWKTHPDVQNRVPVSSEEVFDVRYKLPSGRIVRLRGKFDGLDLILKKLYLQENKARRDVSRENLKRELPYDLQTMTYLTALSLLPYRIKTGEGKKRLQIGGVRYNVIRRPLSGGKFNIEQKKGRGKEKKGAETADQFYARLSDVIRENADHFFFREKVTLETGDLERFQQRCLNPLLEQLLDWWDWIQVDPFDPWRDRSSMDLYGAAEDVDVRNTLHWMYPYGVYNPILEGRYSDYDTLIETGDPRGLTRVETLFRELEGE